MSLTDLWPSIITCLQIVFAAFLFASSLPVRTPLLRRLCVIVPALLAWCVLTATAVPLSRVSELPVLLAGTFVLALLVSAALTLLIFDTTVWAALFCASAGYAMQNLASGIGATVEHFVAAPANTPLHGIIMMVVPFAVVYAICYRLLISRISEGGLELIRPQAALPMMIVVVFSIIIYDVFVKQLFSSSGLPAEALITLRLSHTMLCVLVLLLEYELVYSRRLQREVSIISRIREDEKEQYHLSKETIEAINLKCHDIRHQIRRLGSEAGSIDPQVIDEIEREVTIYDSALRTGNEPLDVILTEKSLLCQQRAITLSCIADGSALAFMAPPDVYSLVGNALDNAIEAVDALADEQRRSVSIVVRRASGMALLHIENYCTGEVSFGEDGMPLTSKADRSSHGFGMRSMRLIARRYDGELHASVRDGIFHLNVVIPIPRTEG